jgi:hypothetical protein
MKNENFRNDSNLFNDQNMKCNSFDSNQKIDNKNNLHTTKSLKTMNSNIPKPGFNRNS